MSTKRWTPTDDIASVTLWGRLLGVVKATHRSVSFSFDDSWVNSGVEVSPLKMPLIRGEVYQFNELLRKHTFQGLPGLLADALPDQFGCAVAAAFLAKRGKVFEELSPVHKLRYMGCRSMGALEFEPALETVKDNPDFLEVRALVEQSRRLISGTIDGDGALNLTETFSELIRVGGSAGGARPKAVVLWDDQAKTIRSGFAKPHKNEKAWLIKFDGTGTMENPDATPKPYNRIEYVYSLMARAAGIEMAPTFLHEDGPYAHFMTQRFDREGGQKHHVHSLGGLMHVDFNEPQSIDYLDLLSVCRRMGSSHDRLEQMFRRIAFNIIAVNQDDHVKNFAFMMKDGQPWDLAPAYDLSFVKGIGWTRNHQIRLMGHFNIDRAEALIDEVTEAVSQWPTTARQNQVPERYIDTIALEHRLFLGRPKKTPKPQRKI